MVTRARHLIILLVLSFLPACGVILNGTTARLPIDSEPQGTEVWLDGVRVGVTPLHVEVSHGADHTIVFKHVGGGEDQSVRIERQLQGGVIVADIFLTGLVGVIVDAATGAWYASSPSSVSVQPQARVAGASP